MSLPSREEKRRPFKIWKQEMILQQKLSKQQPHTREDGEEAAADNTNGAVKRGKIVQVGDVLVPERLALREAVAEHVEAKVRS